MSAAATIAPPLPVQGRLRQLTAVVRMLREAGVIKHLTDYGFEIVGSTPQRFAGRVGADIVKYADIVNKAKIDFD